MGSTKLNQSDCGAPLAFGNLRRPILNGGAGAKPPI
jgi:hypothetical protein